MMTLRTCHHKVHLVRSLGGPLMNFMLGGLFLVLWDSVRSPALGFFAGANLVIGVIVLLPIPSVDGGVIWREILKLLRGK